MPLTRFFYTMAVFLIIKTAGKKFFLSSILDNIPLNLKSVLLTKLKNK